MHFTQIDHIGIAVRDLAQAVATYTRLHGAAPVHQCDVPGEGVAVAMFAVGGSTIELLAPLSDQSPIAAFLAKRGEGLHHICYVVADVATTTERLITAGFTPIQRPTTAGVAGGAIQFFHPRETHGVLIEITQAHCSAPHNGNQ